ncbi:MAG: NADH-ubiquinone oxidoreductase-F iron-sulfur binding region domain-containing protein [Actinomycetota bacterium]|nr:NADH-ubiquinone oxidoreductase-F iron-sulfur binding region domain-containing protein [Actinomycetota bacterium]MEE3186141.1 NADH-ubiquinone oxidoreductase-F iron-sulfur binding region domain-containing protein [Actinomycetota bacterium]
MADLQFSDARADDEEIGAIDSLVGEPAVMRQGERLVRGGLSRRRASRHLLLPGLHLLQNSKGWISPGGLNYLAEVLQVPPAEAYGVASFYDLFETEEPSQPGPRHRVCVDPSCAVAGSAELILELREAGCQVHESPCLGQCDRAPAMFIQELGKPDNVPADADGLVHRQQGSPALRLLKRFGVTDPSDLDSYRSHGGYNALNLALDMGPEAVLDQLTASGLSGRGGAGFPTGRKWRSVAAATSESKHIVANADESEPGTFKDRLILENDPFAVIEAMTIAGVTTGSRHGWVYIRGEYPLATERLTRAIESAHASGLLGTNIAGSNHSFDIEIRRGAGAYICGEETALFNSIEGQRGEPRNKPPFPTTSGLFGEPTVINNPETLINVLEILDRGVDEYRALGTDLSPGTKLFCVSGHVGSPGLYETPFGTPLGQLLEMAGGVTGSLQSILMGGAAGRFVGPEMLDLPLTLEDAAARDTTLGSGAITVFSTEVDMGNIVRRLAKFFRDESCGQCVPCRIGTTRQHEVLLQITDKGPDATQRQLLDDISAVMSDASICGLGHTAASAVQSALDLGLLQADMS